VTTAYTATGQKRALAAPVKPALPLFAMTVSTARLIRATKAVTHATMFPTTACATMVCFATAMRTVIAGWDV
jgi:hypothetical protein